MLENNIVPAQHLLRTSLQESEIKLNPLGMFFIVSSKWNELS